MQPMIKLTDTMLNKHIIDCNKGIREFIYKHFGIRYKDDLDHYKCDPNFDNAIVIYHTTENEELDCFDWHYKNGSCTLPCTIESLHSHDGTVPSQVKFYMTKRGDKRLSIKKIKNYANVGYAIKFYYKDGLVIKTLQFPEYE